MKPILAVVAGVLGLAGCNATRTPAPAPGPGSTSALVGSTLVDCGEGRRALVQQSNGAASVQCVAAPMPMAVADSGYLMAPPALSQPYAARQAPVYADTIAPVRAVAASPAYYEPRARVVERRVVQRSGRTWKKSAAIIGGSTAAGAGVGALLGGGSGAKKGAVVGLLGGTVYDIATRNR